MGSNNESTSIKFGSLGKIDQIENLDNQHNLFFAENQEEDDEMP